jgi:hypothetical protein
LKLNIVISLFFVFFVGFFGYSQTYNYTYTDPCTGNIKNVVVPINGQVTVGYYGYTNNFSASDFTDGTFEAWTTNIFALYGQDSPCSQIVGIGTVVTVTQNTTFTVLGILNSLTTIADVAASGTSNILGGSIGSVGSSSGDGNNNSNKNKNNGNNNVNNNSSNPSGNGSSVPSSPNENQSTQQGSSQEGAGTSSSETSGTTEESSSSGTSSSTGQGGETGQGNTGGTEPNPETTGGTETSSTTSGSEGTSTEGNGTQQQGSEGTGENQETPQTTPEEGQGKTNITAGATTTTKNAPGKSEGGKPSVVASSDFVGFNFRNSEVNYGAKATGGYTAMRWDGQRSWGALADYTSALKGPNITGFYAWVKPKSITLLSGTATIGFDGNKSLYGTIAGGQMLTFQKIPKLKVVYMGTVSYGFIFREQFIGTAAIAGAMYDMKIGKRIDIKLMNLFVYAPYVSYYNDIVLASPYVMLPSIGTNIGITKRFKFNINGGGAWDLKTAALNYTVTCGTRLLIGQ